jgi:hypothetical protein
LRTWRLHDSPELGREIAAESSFDHRLAYLDYEGPVRGDRGRVVRWDGGTYVWITEQAHLVQVALSGNRIRATATLRQVTGSEWIFEVKDSPSPPSKADEPNSPSRAGQVL